MPERTGTDPGTLCSAMKDMMAVERKYFQNKVGEKAWNETSGSLTELKRRHLLTDHGESSVVELSILLHLQCIGADLGKVHLGKDNFRHGSTHHVMRFLGLDGELGNKDKEDDLGLARIGDGFPLVDGVQSRERFKRNVLAEHTRKVDSRGLNKETSRR